jgi:hypothetical protein
VDIGSGMMMDRLIPKPVPRPKWGARTDSSFAVPAVNRLKCHTMPQQMAAHMAVGPPDGRSGTDRGAFAGTGEDGEMKPPDRQLKIHAHGAPPP